MNYLNNKQYWIYGLNHIHVPISNFSWMTVCHSIHTRFILDCCSHTEYWIRNQISNRNPFRFSYSLYGLELWELWELTRCVLDWPICVVVTISLFDLIRCRQLFFYVLNIHICVVASFYIWIWMAMVIVLENSVFVFVFIFVSVISSSLISKINSNWLRFCCR